MASDLAGRPLCLGSVVVVRTGEHAGRLAEVVGMGGRRGVELVVHADADGQPPVFFAAPPERVDLADVALWDPVIHHCGHRG